jgi:hypothetical protein
MHALVLPPATCPRTKSASFDARTVVQLVAGGEAQLRRSFHHGHINGHEAGCLETHPSQGRTALAGPRGREHAARWAGLAPGFPSPLGRGTIDAGGDGGSGKGPINARKGGLKQEAGAPYGSRAGRGGARRGVPATRASPRRWNGVAPHAADGGCAGQSWSTTGRIGWADHETGRGRAMRRRSRMGSHERTLTFGHGGTEPRPIKCCMK